MPVPYRRRPESASSQAAAFLDVRRNAGDKAFYGGLLLIDSRGQPLEFVHNRVVAPAGFLWPEAQVRSLGTAALCHTLFQACRREPALLVCPESLGSAAYLKSEIGAMVPFAAASEAGVGESPSWSWINDPPTVAMPANGLAQELRERGFAYEPFTRIFAGIMECYPEVEWPDTPTE